MNFSRRTLLGGASIIAITAAIPAEARFPRGSFPANAFNGGRSTINPSDLIYGTEFPFLNLMKSSDEWTEFGGSGAAAIVDPSTLDANGYPTSIAIGGPAAAVIIPTQQERPGRYVLTWKGIGTTRLASFAFSYWTGYSSSDLTSSTAAGGRVEFIPTTNNNKIFVGIQAIGTPYITDLNLYHINDEPDILAGRVFGNKFKDRITELRPGVIRFLSWPDNNKTNMTTWLTRKPVNYFSYGSYHTNPAAYCNPASNSLSGKTYSFAAPSQNASTGTTFSLVDKCMVHVKFTNTCPVASLSGSTTNGNDSIAVSSSASLSVNDQVWMESVSGQPFPTNFDDNRIPYFVVNIPDGTHIKLSATQGGTAIAPNATGNININPAILANVGSSGAIVVRGEYANGLTGTPGVSSGNNAYPATDFRALATLVYDADLNSWLKMGGDFAQGRTGITSGVPPELMLQLCIETGTHPYFVMPVFACSPMTDYAPALAAMCLAGAPSWMIPRFEGPNEMWNTATGFYSASYSLTKSRYLWGSYDIHAIYGKMISTVGQAVSSVYSNNRTKYQIMCGVQTALGDTLGGTAACDQRLSSATYVAQAAAAQSLTWSGGTINFTKSAASGWVTHIVVANYWRPSDYGQSAETTASATFAACEVTASISGTAMTVTSTAYGAAATGKKLFGVGIPDGVTIVSGSNPNWVISQPLTIGEERIVLTNWASGVQDTYAATSNSGSGPFTLAKNLTFFQNWKSWATGFGVMKMSCYEGGYSPDMTNSSFDGSNALDQFRGMSKLAAINETFIQTNYNDFVGVSGGGFTAEFPSAYFGGAVPIWNVWQIIDNIYTTLRQPIFEGIKTFNH